MTFRLFLAISIGFSLNSFAEQNSLTLTVLIDGAKANTGQAIASLFTSADNYLKEPISQHILPINDEGGVRFTFIDLKAGTYSVSIVYDEDSNGKLNTGFLGIPSELVGFSKNAKGTFGPHLLTKRLSHCQNQKQFLLFLIRPKNKISRGQPT